MNSGNIVRSVAVIAFMVIVSPSVAYAAEGECNSDYNGQYFSEKPKVSDKLCSSGSAGASIQGDGSQGSPWKWHCYDAQGVEGDRCEAFKNLCGNGSLDKGEQCDGGSDCNNSCEMDAQCGSSHGEEFDSAPSSKLCSVGNPSGKIEGDGSTSNPWKWHCYDQAGNADMKCNATKKAEKIVEEPTVDPSGEAEKAPAAACSASQYSDIKGYVWHDNNRNGKRDSGEKIFRNVTVELYDKAGKEVGEDATSTKGRFVFRDIAPGKYTIDVKTSDSDLAGFHLVYEPDNNLNGKDQITLKCDNDHTGTDFGFDDGASVTKDGLGGNGGGDVSRPTTLAQTGGSWLTRFLALFV